MSCREWIERPVFSPVQLGSRLLRSWRAWPSDRTDMSARHLFALDVIAELEDRVLSGKERPEGSPGQLLLQQSAADDRALRQGIAGGSGSPSQRKSRSRRRYPPDEIFGRKFDRLTMNNMADPPIACTLTPDALAARREGLLTELVGLALNRELLPDGLRLTFDPTSQLLSTIAREVEAERQCCRFLRFGITVEPDGGAIILELNGPPGTREFIAALLEM